MSQENTAFNIELSGQFGEERPLAIDLFTGLHGWADGLVAEGFRVIGFDLEDMSQQFGLSKPPNFHLVIQDVLTLHGSQFRDAALIVASPPCQRYSWMAMPWSKAKAKAAEIRADATGAMLVDLNALFDACFRIQREAIEAAGNHIPLIVENVRGAQPWVGRARWNWASYHLWGDIPALMPSRSRGEANKIPPAINEAIRNGQSPARWTNSAEHYYGGIKNGGDWFGSGDNCSAQRRHRSRSSARKAASAMIAKIPLPLAKWVAYTYHPVNETDSL